MKGILYLGYFGSAVRDDFDEKSDMDILCVLEKNATVTELDLRSFLNSESANFLGHKRLDLSIYSHQRLVEMWKEGHLFAWHISLESMPFKGFECFKKTMGLPNEYVNSSGDISRLIEILSDVQSALANRIVSKIYEAGLIYVAVRNIGISASWYSDAGLNFSRMAPYSLVIDGESIDFPILEDKYNMLIAARHAAVRGGRPPCLDATELRGICEKLVDWSGRVLEKVEACYEH